ncbi:isochorismatase family protein [Brevibacterium album]|uniref:isochorismatase family protein n=1 Tax=Brevibacterium album TaxID=417948 RepID=UPI0003FA00FE|nr:isochorismatase family protein [Brevibacterium album]
MTAALLIVDVQNDFTEGGALGVDGGDATAAAISLHLAAHAQDYALVIASRDWHDPNSDNGGHFAAGEPDYTDNWPVHCVAGTPGADYDPEFDTTAVTHHIRKGQGAHGYSAFEGVADDGSSLAQLLTGHDITRLDIVGIATDHCVRASALDALDQVAEVRVLTELVAGVAPASSQAALEEIAAKGGTLA